MLLLLDWCCCCSLNRDWSIRWITQAFDLTRRNLSRESEGILSLLLSFSLFSFSFFLTYSLFSKSALYLLAGFPRFYVFCCFYWLCNRPLDFGLWFSSLLLTDINQVSSPVSCVLEGLDLVWFGIGEWLVGSCWIVFFLGLWPYLNFCFTELQITKVCASYILHYHILSVKCREPLYYLLKLDSVSITTIFLFLNGLITILGFVYAFPFFFICTWSQNQNPTDLPNCGSISHVNFQVSTKTCF